MSPEIRIIGGEWKGRKIKSCSDDYHPTTAIVKKSLFDSLAAEIEGSMFLDLFAGAGTVGIEALSRGAEIVCFVENDWSRILTLRKNIKHLGIDDKSAEIFATDYAVALQRLRENERNFDLIYTDPPYQGTVPGRVLGDIVTSRILAPDGLLIYEAARKDTAKILETIPKELYPVRERSHGGTVLLTFRWSEGFISCHAD